LKNPGSYIIGGSTKIGDNCRIGFNSTIKHKLTIGSNVIIENGASVINDLPEKDIVAGVPDKTLKRKVGTSRPQTITRQLNYK
jgi:UDP-3-O-[3-hydroxymyristoyl] glucosamine N-acyltransferase